MRIYMERLEKENESLKKQLAELKPEKLAPLPCIICGANPKVICDLNKYHIECAHAGDYYLNFCVLSTTFFETKQEAIAAWNNRAKE